MITSNNLAEALKHLSCNNRSWKCSFKQIFFQLNLNLSFVRNKIAFLQFFKVLCWPKPQMHFISSNAFNILFLFCLITLYRVSSRFLSNWAKIWREWMKKLGNWAKIRLSPYKMINLQWLLRTPQNFNSAMAFSAYSGRNT